MYSYDEIREVHFEVTSKCQARCPQCPRRVPGGGPLTPNLNLTEVDLETFKKWFPVDFLQNLTKFIMCGTYGDPIIAKDTWKIFRYLRDINPDILLAMNTNGSARTTEQWKELAPIDVDVIFAIDGLEDTHNLYRVNTDYNKILENAKAFMDAGGKAHWRMIVFKHNQHQIEDCEKLSKELGFKSFSKLHTSRFYDFKLPVIDDDAKLLYYIEPSDEAVKKAFAIMPKERPNFDIIPQIDCPVKKLKQVYVSSSGDVVPCCFLDLNNGLIYDSNRVDYIDKMKEFPNLNQSTLKEIFHSDYFNKIERSWKNDPLKACHRTCGISKTYEEWQE